MLNMIYISSEDNIISIDDSIPFQSSEYSNQYYNLTNNKHIILGRKTYEKLKSKGINNPEVSVITHHPEKLELLPNLILVSDIEYYLSHLRDTKPDTEIWIVGGKSIFEKSINFVDNVYHFKANTELKEGLHMSFNYRLLFNYVSRTKIREPNGNISELELTIYSRY